LVIIINIEVLGSGIPRPPIGGLRNDSILCDLGKAEAIRRANRLCFPLKQHSSQCHSECQRGIPFAF